MDNEEGGIIDISVGSGSVTMASIAHLAIIGESTFRLTSGARSRHTRSSE